MDNLLLIPTNRSNILAGKISPYSDTILKVKYDYGFQLFETKLSDAVFVKFILSKLAIVRYIDIVPIESYE